MKKLFILMFGIMFLFSFTYAQPFQTSQDGNSIQIESPLFKIRYLNEISQFNIHAFNTSDGAQLNNLTTNCNIHIYSGVENGEHLIKASMDYEIGDFYYNTDNNLFNETGEHGVIFYCSNSDGGGFLQYNFDVIERENKGVFALDLNDNYNIIIIIVLFILSVLAFILKRYEISSLIMIILGFFMLTNDVNIIASSVVIVIGVIIAFTGGENS